MDPQLDQWHEDLGTDRIRIIKAVEESHGWGGADGKHE